jgi:hypothetical protein
MNNESFSESKEDKEEWANPLEVEETSAGMDEKGIAQEFLCQFESSGTTYFGNSDIAWLNSNIIEPVRRRI